MVVMGEYPYGEKFKRLYEQKLRKTSMYFFSTLPKSLFILSSHMLKSTFN